MSILNSLNIENLEKDLNKIIADATALLKQTVEVVIISRLHENPDISRWVEEGIKLHQKEKSKKCEFCAQNLPEDRIRILAGYFNEEDKNLKAHVDTLVQRLEKLQGTVQDFTIIDKANLYPEFQEEYSKYSNVYINVRQDILNSIIQIKGEIENKKLHTTESLELINTIDVKPFSTIMGSINLCINKHNEKSRNFSNAIKEVRGKLKQHYLSEIFDEVQKLKSEIKNLESQIHILENGDPDNPKNIGIKAIQKRIEENKNKISISGLACEEINNQLETFLGRKELVFEDTKEGYLIKRNGKLANNLSEGEKTAIAFVYFTIHLKDRDFIKENGIVVVDDPISSLDSNSLFQAYSFLKNTVEECHQVFIFTHNYDFLQLLLNWLNHIKKGKKFYMNKNSLVNNRRIAVFDKLDELLQNYHSEYQYLFSLLYNFKSDGTINNVYHMPNIARKVLDNFLDIMIPDISSPHKKLTHIKFDENKKTAIYKFTNDQSHITGKGFDPSLPSEAQNVISYLLEMMKAVFPTHYQVLEDSVKNGDTPRLLE